MMEQLYKERILDHARRPRNSGPLEGSTQSATVKNQSCGDVIDLALIQTGGTVVSLHANGTGCAISQAAASLLTEYVAGKSVGEIMHIEPDQFIQSELGIEVSVPRRQCALLALEGLQDLLSQS